MNAITGPINFPYTFMDLSSAIDVVPNQFGRINELDIFPSKPSRSTIVEIRFREGQLTILPAQERGAETVVNKGPAENAIFLTIPHFPEIDLLSPEDLQDIFAFSNGPLRPKTIEDGMNEKLEGIRNKHDITREFLRAGALKGIIIDGANKTLYNLFTVFGIEQKIIDFALDDPTTDVLAKCDELRTYTRLNLKGEVMTGIHTFVDQGFTNKLKSHPNVEKFYLNWQQANALSQDPNPVFSFGGIAFEQYDAIAPNMNGDSVPFIEPNTGYARPVGTRDTFATYDGPVHDIRMVNQPGIPIFVSPEPLKHGAGIELKSQSNCLPVCKRPALLVKLTA